MKFTLRRVRLDNGGYDSTGRYWGQGEPLYYYETESGEVINDHIRAADREDAKWRIRKLYPTATFYR